MERLLNNRARRCNDEEWLVQVPTAIGAALNNLGLATAVTVPVLPHSQGAFYGLFGRHRPDDHRRTAPRDSGSMGRAGSAIKAPLRFRSYQGARHVRKVTPHERD